MGIKTNRCYVKTLLLLIFLLPTTVHAETWEAFLADIRAEIAGKGLDVTLFDDAMVGVKEPIKKTKKKLKSQPEVTYTFKRYYQNLVNTRRVLQGKKEHAEHAACLADVEAKYGVPSEVLVSLWGIESAFGTDAGDFNIIASLATLAYQSHRKEFFKRELILAVQIVDEGHIPLSDMKGSWAGAMGQCQFIPSSFISYAVDEDGDGRKDIWETHKDVFGSSANYLKRRGWQKGMNWGEPVTLTKILPRLEMSRGHLSGYKTLSEWYKLGVEHQQKGDGAWRNLQRKARLFMPNGPSKRVYLVYKNFDVILDWNKATYFAFSVLDLADRIAEKEGR